MCFLYTSFIPEEAKLEEEGAFSGLCYIDFDLWGMSTVVSDSMVIGHGPDGPTVNGPVSMMSGQIEVEFARCDCCGLTEECTLTYIETIRERYGGKWICGLCGEAVEDEILRSQKLISLDEALARHISFCGKFRASDPPEDPTVHLIRAMRQVLRKSLESPKSMKSIPSILTSRRGGTLKGPVFA
ncbi:Protein of unknown function (DUF1677 [Striga hermonthica]|uniref:Uncharacterized protein n=1 Tax=Striga hermonthica TaxID=68872 RepID=A0A9N7NGD2_STRHE|nr:Protein of unknown function (DUF1677 [Striga hermonthica]